MTGKPDEVDLAELTRRVREFAEARDWEQFHTPKNLAMALAVEAAELMEPFQWLTPEESVAMKDDLGARTQLRAEIADVAIYLLRLADVLGVDVGEAIATKIEENEKRFPADEIRGRATLEK